MNVKKLPFLMSAARCDLHAIITCEKHQLQCGAARVKHQCSADLHLLHNQIMILLQQCSPLVYMPYSLLECLHTQQVNSEHS